MSDYYFKKVFYSSLKIKFRVTATFLDLRIYFLTEDLLPILI